MAYIIQICIQAIHQRDYDFSTYRHLFGKEQRVLEFYGAATCFDEWAVYENSLLMPREYKTSGIGIADVRRIII